MRIWELLPFWQRVYLCMACLGDGHHDFRDSDAMMAEHLPEDVCPPALGIVPCDTCNGTGHVDRKTWLGQKGMAAAFVDQIVARMKDEGRLPETF